MKGEGGGGYMILGPSKGFGDRSMEKAVREVGEG